MYRVDFNELEIMTYNSPGENELSIWHFGQKLVFVFSFFSSYLINFAQKNDKELLYSALLFITDVYEK